MRAREALRQDIAQAGGIDGLLQHCGRTRGTFPERWHRIDVSGVDDHRQVGAHFAQAADEFQPAHAGHRLVRHHRVVAPGIGLDRRHGRVPAQQAVRPQAPVLEQLAHEVRHGLLVVDHEHRS